MLLERPNIASNQCRRRNGLTSMWSAKPGCLRHRGTRLVAEHSTVQAWSSMPFLDQ